MNFSININKFILILASIVFFLMMSIFWFNAENVSYKSLILLMGVINLIYIFLFLLRKIDFFSFFIFFLLSLPTTVLYHYLFFDIDNAPSKIAIIPLNDYLTNQLIITKVAIASICALYAFILGGLIYKAKPLKERVIFPLLPYKLNKVMLILFLLATAFMVLSSPGASIMEVGYSGGAFSSKNNLSFLWQLSQVLFLFIFLELFFKKNNDKRFLISFLFYSSLALIVYKYQFLTGNREGFTLIVGFLLIKIFTMHNEGKIKMRYYAYILLMIYFVLVLSKFLEFFRNEYLNYNNLNFFLEAYYQSNSNLFSSEIFSGTWSHIFLTFISVVGDVNNGYLNYTFGTYYLDLLLSVIPNFISNFVGYERPIDSEFYKSFLTYNLGGMYFFVYPFLSFSLLGVIFSSLFLGLLSKMIYCKYISSSQFSIRIMLPIIFLQGIWWLWYGDKYIINFIILFAVLHLFFKFLSSKK